MTPSTQKLIIANWKSHFLPSDVRKWCQDYRDSLLDDAAETVKRKQVVVAPPFPLLSYLVEELKKQQLMSIQIGAQDVSPYLAGAYTGAVHADLLVATGVRYVIVGHSERRRHFNETHQEVARKVDIALQAGMKPILCLDDEYIDQQAAALDVAQLEKVIVAYEELGAIGTGASEAPTKVSQVVERIRGVYSGAPVIYGGSVTDRNVQQYLLISDGVLVGSASLRGEVFAAMVQGTLAQD